MWINIISIYNFILTKYSVLYMLENCSDTCDIILVFLKFILNNLYLIQFIIKILIIIKMK